MSKLTMNTDKLILDGDELKKLANEFNSIIDKTYNKLLKVSEDNVVASESINGVANVLIKTAEYDKQNVSKVGTNMYQLGDKIVNYANDVKSTSNDTIGG